MEGKGEKVTAADSPNCIFLLRHCTQQSDRIRA